MLATPAAAIVVHHDAGADPSGLIVDLAPQSSHYSAWLVAGNDRALELAKPKRRGFTAGRAIEFEIAAAHSGRLDFDDNVMRPRRRIGKFGDLQFASTQETHSAHRKALPLATPHIRSGRAKEIEAADHENTCPGQNQCRNAFSYFDAAAHLSTSRLDPSPIRRARSSVFMSAGRRMADHIAAAQRYRARAAKCELSAKNTTSAGFGECYRLLARHYLVLANLEEDCAHRQSPFARPQDSKPEEQAVARSVAARMFAVRQMQRAAPSMETVSMPPMALVAVPAAEFGP
jgi:hypothetical protein